MVQEGAREVYACTSHAVFSPPAIERLSSGVFEEVIVTNTIPVAQVWIRMLFCLLLNHALCAFLQASSATNSAILHVPVFQACRVTSQFDTPLTQENIFPELTILSVANLLGETIWRVYNATSVQALRD